MRYILWFFLISLIIFRYFSTRPIYKDGDHVRVTTQVLSDPKSFGKYQFFSACGLKVYLPAFPQIYYGDKIVLDGVVGRGVNGRELKDAKLISVDSLSVFGSGIRKKIIDFYQKNLPEPTSGLVSGIVLGSKTSLSYDFWQKTKDVGVSHIVVASGTNITFIVSFIFSASALYVSRRKTILIVIISIILYLFVSGFEPPLIRAALMAVITFGVQSRGRLVAAWKVLFLTAGIMLVIEPDWLTDLGFVLSFASLASIMAFGGKLSKFFKKLPKIIRESFSTTLSAQAGVAPILFFTFGQFNLLSPIVNILVLWTVPAIMILGSLGGVVGLIVPIFGKLILYVSYPLTWWFVKIVELFSNF